MCSVQNDRVFVHKCYTFAAWNSLRFVYSKLLYVAHQRQCSPNGLLPKQVVMKKNYEKGCDCYQNLVFHWTIRNEGQVLWDSFYCAKNIRFWVKILCSRCLSFSLVQLNKQTLPYTHNQDQNFCGEAGRLLSESLPILQPVCHGC